MNFKIASSLSEIVINQLATLKSDSNVKEMIDVTYTYDVTNHTWNYTNSENYTVVNPYSIISEECTKVTTDTCSNTIINPGEGTVPPSGDDDIPPEEDEDYPTPECPQDKTICIPFISDNSELSLNYLCKVQRNVSYHHSRCGDNLTPNQNINGAVETLNGTDPEFCGELSGIKSGNNVIYNINNGYDVYSIGNTVYRRPYKQFHKVTYISMDELCDPNDSESGYYETVSGSLDALKTTCLSYNLYCYWGKYLTAVAGTMSSLYADVNWDGEHLSIPSSNTAAIGLVNEAIDNYSNNIVVAYYTTVNIGDYYTRYYTNVKYDDEDLDSPQKFIDFINQFKNIGTESIEAKKGSDEISTGVTLDDYFNGFFDYSYISNNISVNKDTPLTDGWCTIFSLTDNSVSPNIYDNDSSGTSLLKSLSTLVTEELESNNKCSQCENENNTGSNDCYGYNSDGSVTAIHTNTTFAIISRVPYKYENNKWEYIYSVKVYNKEKNITFSKTKKAPNITDNEYIKRSFLDYPFSSALNTDPYYEFDNTRLIIKRGLFNTFYKDNSDKAIGGTIYNVIEDYERHTTHIDIDTDQVDEKWNYYKSGDSIYQCSKTSTISN